MVNGTNLEDRPVTRPDHPMVKYATAFTQNFDLIAERKSAIFHLRELAKASITAKHVLDSGIKVEEAWFHLGDDKEVVCSLEVPQLWNERMHSQVDIENRGTVRNINSNGRGVYGGVQFGLSKFDLATSVARPARLPLQTGLSKFNMATSIAMQTTGLARGRVMPAISGAAMPLPGGPSASIALGAALSAASMGAPRAAAVGASLGTAVSTAGVPQLRGLGADGLPAKLQGVDLRLDQFDL